MVMHSIKLEKITKTFIQQNKITPVLSTISYIFHQKKTYTISGASGVGKSTLLHIIAGLDKPTTGEVFFDQEKLSSLSTKKKNFYSNSCLGFVFQNPYLINEFSVMENVILKGIIGGLQKKKCEQQALILLHRVGLYEKRYATPCQLSGGQQQRVALARALLNKPAFLFADEPTGNLDKVTSKQIVDLLLEYRHEYGMGLIISTHDSIIIQKMETALEIKEGNLYEKSLFF